MQGYYYTPRPRLTPEQREDLRDDGNFVGGILIVVLICLTFVFSTVATVLLSTGILAPDALTRDDLGLGNTGYLLLYACVYTVSMGGPALLCCLLFHRSPRTLLTVRPVRITTGAAAVVSGMGGCVAANMIASMLASFLQSYGIPLPESPSFLEATPVSLLLNLFVLAMLPALLEEFVFRGCVLGALRKYGDWFAIVISALLFGLIHGGITQSVFAVIVGFVLGYITVSTGNIWLAIIIHFCNNALSVVLEYVTLPMEDMTAGLLYSAVLYPLGISGVFVAVVSAVFRSPLYSRLSPSACPAGQGLAALWKAPLMIIGSILILLRIAQSFFL